VSNAPLWRRALGNVIFLAIFAFVAYETYRSTGSWAASISVLAVQGIFAVYWLWFRKTK
jgi:uncharacterized membrane protein YobD (UPF0266 family)